MAVKIKCLSVVVPIENINKTSEGLPGLLEKFGNHRGKAFWLDEHLYVEFAMNPADTQAIVERWESVGLIPRTEEAGQRVWKDLCVVDFYRGPTLPCGWLTYDVDQKVAWKTAAGPESTVGPDFEGDPAPLFVPRERGAEMAGFLPSNFHEKAVPFSRNENAERKPWWKFW